MIAIDMEMPKDCRIGKRTDCPLLNENFMSDEELKENGINIPKKRITNREKLARMSNQELAEYICVFTDCYKCIGQALCAPNGAKANGVKKWLESEAEEES